MPKFKSSQEWLEQSALLLKAYPTTTKITAKYNLPNPKKPLKSRKRKAPADDEDATKTENEAQTRLATLEVRTYNPEAGVVLKYSTTRGWEVGRLMASLGKLGRHMAALPELAEDAVMPDAKEEGVGVQTPATEMAGEKSKPSETEGRGGLGSGGGKKKKKSKR
ncbi:uncharacterized protein PV09_05069 [Verruconis gallopava]|uniref:SRP9 domain-containing protein n=1 Tax=Verruconis gallopava TaxID=253628 RepID=A0A0D2AX47_9PEZI|nr:uncharacterized protein PV09_05069 [Verruconis gallopava]KIW03764.1 hypothetical protein PV09_05069 [Verruconis gallopava]